MIPKPASKCASIVEELNIMGSSYDPDIHQFRLAQIEKEAEKLKQEAPEEAYTILGIIACMKGNIENMHRYHKNAIKCSGESFSSLKNYGFSLYHQGLLEDAYVYYLKAHEQEKANPSILNALLDISFFLGLDENYDKFKENLDKLNVKYDDPKDFYEDDEDWLEKTLTDVEDMLHKHPDLIVKPDPEIESLIDDLIEGVVID